jgi:hypothetical protein
MKIPLVGEPEVSVPGQTFARVNPDTFARVGEAGQRLGESVEGLGDVAMRIKSVYDDAAITKVTTQLDAGKRDAINSLTSSIDPATGKPDERNNDPTTYGQRWQEMKAKLIDAAQNDPMAKSLGREGQLRLKTAMGSLMVNGDQDVKDLTRQKMIQVAGAVNDVAMKGLVMSGKEDEAQALAAKQVRTGEKTPEWGAEQKILIPQQIDQNAAIHLMSTDVSAGGGPFVAEDKLKEQDASGNFTQFKRLLPEQRQELLRQASYDGRILRDQVANKYGTYIANAQPVDPAEVKADLTYRTISPTLARTLLKPSAPSDTPEAYNDVMSRISKLDPAAKDYNEQFEIGKAINNFTGINKDRAEQLFKDKMNPNSPLNSPGYKAAAQTIEGNFTAGIYGRLSYKVMEKDGSFSTKPDAKGREAANNRRAELLTAAQHFVSQYAQDNDGASPSPQQINDYLNSFQKVDRATSFWGKPVNPLSGKAAP